MKSRIVVSKRRAQRQRGSSLVEGTLVLLSLMGMILFVMDLGRVLFTMQYSSERARAGARYATVHTYDPDAIINYIVYNDPNMQWVSQSDGDQGMSTAPPVGLMGLTRDKVSVSRLNAGTIKERIQIKISGLSMTLYTPPLTGTFNVPPATVTIPVESLGATD
jgi:hypothetical protein